MLRLAAALAALVVLLTAFALFMARHKDGEFAAGGSPGPTIVAGPSSTGAQASTNGSPPSGLPFLERPPAKLRALPGQQQPVATRYGWTYDLPPDWQNRSDSVAGWGDSQGEIVRYGSIGRFGHNYCSASDGSRLAMSGAGGRNGMEPETAARTEVELAERIFASEDGRKPRVEYIGPSPVTMSGRIGTRYTAIVNDIPQEGPCDPPSAQFDVVALPGSATAEVMVLMVEFEQGVPGALDPGIADRIMASLRPSDGFGE